jgi:ATP-dependent RNA helicase MSS116
MNTVRASRSDVIYYLRSSDTVPQSYLITPLERILSTLVSLLVHAGPQAKTMLFCTTARGTAVIASILQQVSASKTGPLSVLPPIHQIHSRMSQPARTRAAQAFRDSPEGAILVTSDVTARGMDFPRWVSLVSQYPVLLYYKTRFPFTLPRI